MQPSHSHPDSDTAVKIDAPVNAAWQQQLADWFLTSCRLEVLSPKPGNVNPLHAFADATVDDFLRSAAAAAPCIAQAPCQTLGQTLLTAVQATRSVVAHNTNLGILLLIAPLASVPPGQSLADGVNQILQATTLDDSKHVYAAIRLAAAGGLGKASDQDVNSPPTLPLIDCMQLAADRDLIAADYCNGFQRVLVKGLNWLRQAQQVSAEPGEQITWLALQLMADAPDSLILRKCGPEIASTAQTLARQTLAENWPALTGHAAFRQLDQYLRADGHRRNPGTTADFVAAILFSALREGLWRC
ncbi:MAG: triphosphoribosyl-dephospho-CoA synthase [Planctomycetota bacterium]